MVVMTGQGVTTRGGGGLRFGTILFLIFLVLKLTNAIGWSWWWVTAPLWIVWAFVGLGVLVLYVMAILFTAAGQAKQSQKRKRK